MASGLFSILSTARSALVANQYASQVAAHNISNATTEGYSRQRAELVPSMSVAMPYGRLGTGVLVDDVVRARDALLDTAVRRESSAAAEFRSRYELLAMVEGALGEPGDTGLGAAIDAFWASWSDLAADPAAANGGTRTVIQASGRALAERFRHLTGVIDQTRDFATGQIREAVAELNELARAVADVNGRIVAAEAGGDTAPDLRDERDRLIDRMAGLAGVQVVERQDGTVGVHLHGINIVDGIRAIAIEARFAGNAWTLHAAGGSTLAVPGGRIGALLDVVNNELPALQNGLDLLARAIVTSVNDLHAAGTNPRGDTGVLFFDDFGDPALVTARNIALSAEVAGDARAIAAGTGSATGEYQPGANDIALALAQLRDTAETVYLGGRTFGDYYAGWISELGLAVGAAEDAATVHQTLLANAEARRSAVSGVQTDEELIQLLQFHSAYSAAARVVATADEMLQSLLSMV